MYVVKWITIVNCFIYLFICLLIYFFFFAVVEDRTNTDMNIYNRAYHADDEESTVSKMLGNLGKRGKIKSKEVKE